MRRGVYPVYADSRGFQRGPLAAKKISVMFAWRREDSGRFLWLAEAQ